VTLAALALLLPLRSLRADVPLPAEVSATYSHYEQETIDAALASLGRRADPCPDGKRVEAIALVSLDVVEDRDPAPLFLNAFHVTSLPHVIAREVLLAVGAPWRQDLVDETARNLRKLDPLSLALTIAARGNTPQTVRLVVITKDVWSLRLGTQFAYGPGGLEQLILEPVERNLAGTHLTTLGRLTLQPASVALGLGYRNRRVFGSRIYFYTDGHLIWNRRSGEPEGSFGGVLFGEPLWSLRTPWAWSSAFVWRREVTRRYVDARVGTFDAAGTSAGDAIPFQWDTRAYTETLGLTRSVGLEVKHDLSFGGEVNARTYEPPVVPGVDPVAMAEFRRERVPVGQTRVGPYVQYHTFRTEFARVIDLETLGLQEDYGLGHDLALRVYPVLGLLGSSRTLLGSFAMLQHTLAFGDGLGRLSVELRNEFDGHGLSDGNAKAGVRLVSPRLALGRVVLDATALSRYRNGLNRVSYLGGATRLRGYPSNALVGKDLVAANLEWRSRPFRLRSLHVGGAVFWDSGDAADGLGALRIKHAAGVGLRVLVPNLNRIVFRADLGVPLAIGGPLAPGLAPASFFIAVGQAFPVPQVGTTPTNPEGEFTVDMLGQ